MSGCSPMSSVSRSECVLRDVAYIRMLQCAGVCCNALVYVAMPWCMLQCAGVCCNALVYVAMPWCMLQCAGVYVRITVGGTGLGLLDTRCCLQGLKSILQCVTTWGLWVCVGVLMLTACGLYIHMRSVSPVDLCGSVHLSPGVGIGYGYSVPNILPSLPSTTRLPT